MNETTNGTNGVNGAETRPQEALAVTVRDNNENRSISAFSSMAAFEAAQRMAKALASSTMVPKEYQNNLPNVLIAMELASRTGASVYMVMQNLDIIHGRPSWRATFLIATVNASGRFTPLRFRWEGKPGDPDWSCRAHARDLKTREECIGARIDLALANKEGWSTKPGSKWLTMPEQMMMYRAAAFWTRAYAPELSLGMQTADEVIDVGTGEITEPVAVAVAKVADALEAQPVPEPEPAPAPKGRKRSLKDALEASVEATATKVPPAPASEPKREREPGEEG